MNPRASHLKLFSEGLGGPCSTSDAVAAFEEEDSVVWVLAEVSSGDEAGETSANDYDVVAVVDGGGGSSGRTESVVRPERSPEGVQR